MSASVLSETSYVANQTTIATSLGFAEFQARFEKAVPRVIGLYSTLAAYAMPWGEVVSMTAQAAPLGFLMYLDSPIDCIMRKAGHNRRTCAYLIGNHVDVERMYRHSPAVVLHSPLRVVLWEDEHSQTMFTFDHPGAQFTCFNDPRIAEIGVEINEKFVGLLKHLELPIPDSLRGHEPQIKSQGQRQAASSAQPQLLP